MEGLLKRHGWLTYNTPTIILRATGKDKMETNLVIKNTTPDRIVFKVKINISELYSIKPNQGAILGLGEAVITLTMRNKSEENIKTTHLHKLMIEYYKQEDVAGAQPSEKRSDILPISIEKLSNSKPRALSSVDQTTPKHSMSHKEEYAPEPIDKKEMSSSLHNFENYQ